MQPPLSSLDPARCPLCGVSNGCAMALAHDAGVEPSSCWCMTAAFDEALRARVPVEARGKACICARCAASAQA